MAKWRQAIGLVCLAALPGAISQAYAFGLGHATVKSALGQPLRADIDITQITPNEASSLKVAVAPASAFQSRKLNYSSILPEVTITLEHRPDGRPYLLLSSSRPVQEPFVDVLLRAYWANGELTRDYTLLFDPPNFTEPRPATQIAPQVSQQSVPPAAVMPPPVAQQAPASPENGGFATPAKPVAAQRQTQAAPAPAPVAEAHAQPRSYTVRKGDTLSSIARKLGIETVSLDQMLTALYRANSGAFIDSNMNLLRAGAILRIPSSQEVQDIPQTKAREVVIAQSQSFQAYRRRLAEMTDQAAPQRQTNARESAGKIQAVVQEPLAKASEPKSQLKLSKAAVGPAAQAQAEQASKIAAQQEAKAAAAKLAAAQANVAALTKLAANASAAMHAATPAVPSSPLAVVPPVVPAPVAPAAVAKASAVAPAPIVASAAKPAVAASVKAPLAVPASKPAVVAKPVVAPKVSAASAQPSWFSSLLSNPYFAPAAGLIALLLAAWAFLRRRKKDGTQRDSSVFDSRLSAADSFFGGTGGERVDTRNSTLGSSVAYSPSQLDTGDVDPVAEADVYLAYGRDLQAEEILKESLKNHPDRNAARLKLLEIYAKRKDVRSFEMSAAELFALTEGVGEDWKKAQDLGRHLDPINPLYHNTVPPSTIGAPATIPASDFAPTGSSMLSAPMTLPATELLTSLPSLMKTAPAAVEPAGSGLDLDLNLSGPPAAPLKVVAPTPFPRSEPVSAAVEGPVVADQSEAPLNFDFSGFHAPDSTLPVIDEPAQLANKKPLEFDLGALSLDLPSSAGKADAPSLAPAAAPAPAKPAPAAHEDLHFTTHDSPLTEPMLDSSHGLDTRLALVEECRAMGDVDMARNLLGEIIAESEGATKARAERMLAELR